MPGLGTSVGDHNDMSGSAFVPETMPGLIEGEKNLDSAEGQAGNSGSQGMTPRSPERVRVIRDRLGAVSALALLKMRPRLARQPLTLQVSTKPKGRQAPSRF